MFRSTEWNTMILFISICNDGNEIVIIISHDWLNLIQYNVMIHKVLLRGKRISWGLRSLMMSVAKKEILKA